MLPADRNFVLALACQGVTGVLIYLAVVILG